MSALYLALGWITSHLAIALIDVGTTLDRLSARLSWQRPRAPLTYETPAEWVGAEPRTLRALPAIGGASGAPQTPATCPNSASSDETQPLSRALPQPAALRSTAGSHQMPAALVPPVLPAGSRPLREPPTGGAAETPTPVVEHPSTPTGWEGRSVPRPDRPSTGRHRSGRVLWGPWAKSVMPA